MLWFRFVDVAAVFDVEDRMYKLFCVEVDVVGLVLEVWGKIHIVES